MKNNPLVSIIIPTYNSEKTLSKCLQSIKNQTHKNIEIVVVDKGSTDRTIEIAKEFNTRVYVIGAKERSEQVNYGAKKAKGKYIYRVDSDFILEESIVEEAVRKCERDGYDAICIHNTSDPTISFWSKVRKFERDMYKDDELNVAARFFRKDVFERVGGFDEKLVAAEDYDFHNKFLKADYKIGRIDSEEIHIGEPKTLWEITKRHHYYGKTLVKFIEKNKEKGMKQLSPIRPAFTRHWKKFIKHPILTFGFIIYQLVKYSSGGLGYLIAKIKS